MTADSKPGDAVADKWREEFEKNRKESDLALTRLEVRAEMKSSGEEELSDVIDREALERHRVKALVVESTPPDKASPMVIVLTVAKKFPAWGAVIVALAGIAAWVAVKLLAK
jgi:hypothetical protein